MSSGQLVGLLRCDGQPRVVRENEKKKGLVILLMDGIDDGGMV